MDNLELAWKVIDHYQKDYTSKGDMIDELGNLDDLALRIMEVIELEDLKEEDGMEFISMQVDMALF